MKNQRILVEIPEGYTIIFQGLLNGSHWVIFCPVSEFPIKGESKLLESEKIICLFQKKSGEMTRGTVLHARKYSFSSGKGAFLLVKTKPNLIQELFWSIMDREGKEGGAYLGGKSFEEVFVKK